MQCQEMYDKPPNGGFEVQHISTGQQSHERPSLLALETANKVQILLPDPDAVERMTNSMLNLIDFYSDIFYI